MMEKMRGMPQGHPLLPAPDGLTFYLDLIYQDCTAVLSALDLTNPNALWETFSLVLGGPDPPPPPTSFHQHLRSSTLTPSCCLRSSVSPPPVGAGPEPDLPQLDHDYKTDVSSGATDLDKTLSFHCLL